MLRNSVVLWVLAFVITALLGYYQRVTGPTYAVTGTATMAGTTLDYKLRRTHPDMGVPATVDAPVTVRVPDSTFHGTVEWKRFKTDDPWQRIAMEYTDGSLRAMLPGQPPAGKLQYRVVLSRGEESQALPTDAGIVIRFKGEVPLPILILHIIVIFGAMLFSTRAGLEYFSRTPSVKSLSIATVGLLAVGGMILGPIVQKYAFDAYWTGWPFGTDLTDNKTLVALVAWVVAWVAIAKAKHPRRWVIGAAVVTFVVFLIPHSLLGSELDYRKLDAQSAPVRQR
jgi:hypothetical protein